MQFTPDQRNLGGKFMILSQIQNHRVCLQQIKDRQIPKTPSIPKLSSRKKKIEHNYEQPPLTDRPQQRPVYFFRRLPSPPDTHLKLLYKKPLNYKSHHQLRIEPVQQADPSLMIPQTARSTVDWNKLISTLKPQLPLKEWIKEIAFTHRIFEDYDFAILIRLLVYQYKLKQQTLVNIVAEIIEELER
ncbi:hypothetical protein pb186bvf_006936 [Paramecium bursaria]